MIIRDKQMVLHNYNLNYYNLEYLLNSSIFN